MSLIQSKIEEKVAKMIISGAIDDELNFDEFKHDQINELHIYCKGVSRFNSKGIKSWVKFFKSIRAQGTRLKFFECSAAIIEQINVFPEFVFIREVESLHLPYGCPYCGSEYTELVEIDDLQTFENKMPEVNCPKCDRVMVFDDIEDIYFHLIKPKNKAG